MHRFDDIAALVGGRRIRVVGDVHGDLAAFRHAAATNCFVIQLGDLVDYGPDSVGTLRLMAQLMDEKRGLFILGNHDRKLGRALMGRKLRRDVQLEETLDQIYLPENADILERALPMLTEAPAWITLGNRVFVHGAFHTRMLVEYPTPGLESITPQLSRAFFGETTNRMQADGYPERRLSWVDLIPPGHTVYVGHDRRSTDGRPWVKHGRNGGTAVFVDTGAGKGGHLAWIDLPEGDGNPPDYPVETMPGDW